MTDPRLLPEEKYAKDTLESIGLTVQPIKPTTYKTPEFFATDGSLEFVVEVKSRKDSELWKKGLNQDNIAIESRSSSGRWAIDQVRAAKTQMLSVDPKKEKIWVTWLSIDCKSATKAMFEQTLYSFFGIREFIDKNTGNLWTCVGAMPTAFQGNPKLSASVVTSEYGETLCINENSPDYSLFIQSQLYKAYSELPPLSHSSLLLFPNTISVLNHEFNWIDDSSLITLIKKLYPQLDPLFLDLETTSVTMRIST